MSESTEINLHDEFDASVWASEFKRLFPDSDEDLMLGWFANAIMAGYDHARRQEIDLASIVEERSHPPFTFTYTDAQGNLTDNPYEARLTLEEAVFQALGYASMCWSQTPTGVFDSTAAKTAGDALIAYIEDML